MVSHQPLSSLVAACKHTFRLMFKMCRVNRNITGKQKRSCRRRTALVLVGGARAGSLGHTHTHTIWQQDLIRKVWRDGWEGIRLRAKLEGHKPRFSEHTVRFHQNWLALLGSHCNNRTMEGSLLAPLMNSSSDSLPDREENQNGNHFLKVGCCCHHCCSKESLLTEAT